MKLSDYRPPRWLRGAHLETIYPALMLKMRAPVYQREVWTTPDGDEIAVDFLHARVRTDRPFCVHFHGLEGSSHSHYAVALMHTLRQHDWQGAVVHFRGCGGHPNKLPRAYHAGDSHEIDWVLRRLAERAQQAVYAVGVSLGGNALAKWAGEQGVHGKKIAAAIAVVSAPLDLIAAGSVLDTGFNRQVYTRVFLQTLRPKTLGQLAKFEAGLPGVSVHPDHIARSQTFREFDDHVTAPLHGFKGVLDYWKRASSKPLLRQIDIPTLLINARNDPFLPAHALPGRHEVSPAVTLMQPARGGHVGFVEGAFPGNIHWLPRTILRYFQQVQQAHPPKASNSTTNVNSSNDRRTPA
ncbi:alpha/beta fold hydrolase [Burkholderiaceae bacterium DAT-1]|nr:alpha/beta fold hydrolase [Burkholderiaceae bacterium DAT-1]